jgi:potassium efflux system protein
MLSTLLSDSLLALQWMNKVTIWEVVTPTETGNIIEIISLKSALSALIIFGLSLFSAKNLPGLLELLVLHRLNISTGTAYATTTLLRYLIVLSGTLIAVSTLGFNWSRLQWLVAALSVGLGFGLQEIFANFVSGIILLFERPVRVGDTITIQNLTGVVTRINTRATTILDWDKKEIVVPNKSLITDQLINWSLSDATTRIIIPIGVAYGSDLQLVKSLLIQAATQCSEISLEPPPQALFLLFGASSLDFELRVFLPQLEGRPAIKDKLNTNIEQLFRQHHIEIPFPQMDLHIRDLPEDK